jgi:hypothetical protein
LEFDPSGEDEGLKKRRNCSRYHFSVSGRDLDAAQVEVCRHLDRTELMC